MEYRNIKTGVVVTVSSEVSGENWERVDVPKNAVKKEKSETPKKETKRNK